mmetsp:Transcript_41701/g.114934  ORF Transcript_41701/g.114934 Transcript_41701/m.114934 type:complete len:270 (-) Transcript_41701:412-1221(-)
MASSRGVQGTCSSRPTPPRTTGARYESRGFGCFSTSSASRLRKRRRWRNCAPSLWTRSAYSTPPAETRGSSSSTSAGESAGVAQPICARISRARWMPLSSSSAVGWVTPTEPMGRPRQRQTKATPKAAISCSVRSLVPPCARSLTRPHRPNPTESSARSQFIRSVFDHTCASARRAARLASSSSRAFALLPFFALLSSRNSSVSISSAIPNRFTCFDLRLRKYSASSASFCSSSGRILVQNSGSSMSTALSSATKAAREKTEPEEFVCS